MLQNKQHVALLCLAIALIYLAFPTRVYYWDGIAFAQAIEDVSGLQPSLAHPNHLIYNFAGYLFYRLLTTLGLEVRAITALQILNSLLSAVCAVVLFVILKRTIRSQYLSLCLTALFAFSATWWKFSTDANAYVPSMLFMLAGFYLVLPHRKPNPLLLAITFFLAMAFHQLAVLMFPTLALGIYLQNGPTCLRRQALNAVYFSVAAFVLIACAYACLFFLASGSLSVSRLLNWSASYSPDADTTFNVWSNFQYSLRGQVRLFFGGRLNLLKGITNPIIFVLIACLIAAAGFLLFEVVKNFKSVVSLRRVRALQLDPSQKTVLLLSLVWSVVYLVFLYFWLPQNTFYRLFYLPAFIVILGLALSSFKQRIGERRRFTPVLVAAIALANFLFLIYPFSHVEKYPPLKFALEMNRVWPRGTVIYYTLKNSDEGLVRYFNPGTHWRLIRPESTTTLDSELANIYHNGDSAWFETTAIDQFANTAEGTLWFETHARKETWKQLNDDAYKIRFVQVGPR